MNMTHWMQEIINNDQRRAIPIMTHPGIEMAGNSIKEAVQSGVVHARAIQVINEHFPIAAATSVMDLTLEAEAFGCRIDFPQHEMPNITGRLVSGAEEIDALGIPDLTAGRIPYYLEAARLTADKIHDKPVLGGVIGPFSLAGRLYDMSEIMVAIYTEPDAIHLLLEKCTLFILSYCRELKRLGCSGVVMAEPAAGLLSNEDCIVFSTPFIRHIVSEVQDDNFLVVLHNCGNRGHCTEAMLQTGARALHFGNAINMTEALEQCPTDMLILGNIDPVGVLKQLPPNQIKEKVTSLLNDTAGFKNFVLSSGCDMPPNVPAENIKAFFEALNAFNGTRKVNL